MVSARHLIGAAIVVSVAVAVGCTTKPRAKARPSPSPSSAVAGVGKPGQPNAPAASGAPVFEPADSDGVAGVAEVSSQSLAQHSERYAKNLESLLSKRERAGGADADHATPAGGPANAFPGISDSGHAPGHASGDGAAGYSTLPPAAPEQPDAPAAPAVPAAQANTSMDVTPPARGHAVEVEVPVPNRQARADARTRARPAGAEASPPARAPATQPDAETPGAKATATVASETTAAATNDLLRKLAAKVKEDPRDTVSHLNYQLLQFLLEEQVPELKSIAPLPAEDRELLTALLDGLSNFRTGLRAEANSLQSKKVAPLLELADRLRSQGELTLSTAALCRSVQRFGVYEPMDPPRFVAGGKDNAAILYCEVANFSSQLNDKKLWETKLKQEAVLYSESGLPVWSDRTDTVVDQSRNRLHDFFIADKVRLPASLPVGRYLMKMTVTDLHASRVAEATVPIQVVAQ